MAGPAGIGGGLGFLALALPSPPAQSFTSGPLLNAPAVTPSVTPAVAPAVNATAITTTNANTTYGVDTSAANNYGLGPNYMSTQTLQGAQAAQSAAPSLWWLLLAFVAIEVLA